MKLKSYYLDEFIEKYKTMFNEEPIYDDETGIYKFPELNIKIKKWNYHIEVLNQSYFDNELLINIIEIINKCETYYFEKIEKGEENE